MSALNCLKLRDFRCHSELNLALRKADWVVLAGGNGAGKTSLLEAIYAATRGRSFRAHPASEVIRQGAAEANVLIEAESSCRHRLGVVFGRHSRTLHLDGSPVSSMAEVTSAIPIEYIGGTAHYLVDGTPAAHRRFLDWGLFHVEPRFLATWRAWHRAHRQRNEWLRRGDYPASEGWTAAVIEHGEALSRMRAELVERLAAALESVTWAELQGAALDIRFNRGWREDSFAEALSRSAKRERKIGRAVVGPQYDDWSLECDGLRAAQLSRGQSKLAGFFLLHVLAKLMREAGRAPVLLVDDFLADLDSESSRRAVRALSEAGGQVWIAVREE
ncbi:MAG: DNA replication/repair protein RecF, partial [Bryobacteraceae bacterium]